ncbi:hypothetical protein L6164_023546 [Bauhinia variegata]|uniref:Uncharacterized protein n=1 Tax=Bauhinia variegata TaxID=167791 RepID=A0ACB9MIV5_BAUVA|nr:hypothetical protein L6164_023546 [Bauhinia variegata]
MKKIKFSLTALLISSYFLLYLCSMFMQFELKRGHFVSSLECYMKEYGVSRQDAIEEIRKLVSNCWKEINEDCLKSSQIPRPFLMRVFNFARMMDVIYKDQHAYTHAEGTMKNYIAMVLVDTVQI